MKERFKTSSAVFLVIEDAKGNILFQRRQNTGYMDGYLDLGASGHIEKNETASQAAIRELKEEVNLLVKKERLEFMAINHRLATDQPYFDFYFRVQVTEEEKQQICINEPYKVSELLWLKMDQLPTDVIDYNRFVLDQWQSGKTYLEWL